MSATDEAEVALAFELADGTPTLLEGRCKNGLFLRGISCERERGERQGAMFHPPRMRQTGPAVQARRAGLEHARAKRDIGAPYLGREDSHVRPVR